MRVLFIGDLDGKCGLNYLKMKISYLRQTYKPNLIIVNGENCTNGKGLSKRDYKEIMGLNVSCLTMGNHTFRNPEINDYIESSKIVRPMNMTDVKGNGYIDINYNGKVLTVINLIGTVSMKLEQQVVNPFITVKEFLASHKSDYTMVDFHAEATSEKIAMGYMLDGVVNAVVGTHTHVQTADNRVLDKGTLYISDVGMTGPKDAVIGVKKEIIIDRFLEQNCNQAFEIDEDSKPQLNAVIMDFDKKSIERIHLEN